MGNTTPNIGIYVPVGGETLYDQSFLNGMINIDQHDHSGAPNKGLPIGSASIDDGAITYNLLNANVVDTNPVTNTGVGTDPSKPNQIILLGILKNLFQLATSTGFLAKNGSAVAARTFQDSSSIAWTNADGSGGNPSASIKNFIGNTSWTPTLAFGGASVGITYSVQTGYYIRIYNLVFFTFYVGLSNKGSSTGTATLEGFPVTMGPTNLINRITIAYDQITLSAGYTTLWLDGLLSATNFDINQSGSGVSAVNTDNTNFSNTSAFFGNGLIIIQ